MEAENKDLAVNKERREKLLKRYREKYNDPFYENDEQLEEFIDNHIEATETALLPSGKEMEKVFGVMKNVAEGGTGIVQINCDGLMFKELGEDHTMMVELRVPPEALEDLDLKGAGTAFEADASKFKKFFGRTRASEKTKLQRKGANIVLEFPESNRQYSVNAEEAMTETVPDLANVEREAHVWISPSDFKSALIDCSVSGDLVRLEMKDGDLMVRSAGILDKSYYGSYERKEADSQFTKVFEDVDGSGETIGVYRLDLMKKAITNGLGDLKLVWAEGFPLSIQYEFFDEMATLEAFIAPWVED